jgi:uncharacterized protein YciI
MSKRFFAAFVHRAEAWDNARPPHEQSGFPDHAKFVAELESSGFIAIAGLMQPSNDVLFVFRAESEEAVRLRMAADPWQQDGHARLGRVEEVNFRIGEPGA